MRFIKLIIGFLILVLASGPVLASACAAKCASAQARGLTNVRGMTGTAHCHESTSTQSNNTVKQDQLKHGNSSKHAQPHSPACVMGASCGLSQMATFGFQSPLLLSESSILTFLTFITADKSIDLSPPLKPPA